MKERQITLPGRKPLVAIAALALGCGVGTAAQAEDLKATGEFGWFAVGKVQQLEKGHLFWVGEFSGSFSSDKGEGSPFHHAGVRCPGSNDVDLNNKRNKAAGTCVLSDPSGADQAFLSWACEGDTHMCRGTITYTGGTGKYQGTGGQQPFTGYIQVNWPDGMSSGYAVWGR